MVIGHQERVGWPAPNWMIQPAPRPIFSGESESEEGMICMSLDAKFKWDMVSDERFWMSGPQPMQELIWWLLPQIEALNLCRIWYMIYQWVLFFTWIEDLKSESQYIFYVDKHATGLSTYLVVFDDLWLKFLFLGVQSFVCVNNCKWFYWHNSSSVNITDWKVWGHE